MHMLIYIYNFLAPSWKRKTSTFFCLFAEELKYASIKWELADLRWRIMIQICWQTTPGFDWESKDRRWIPYFWVKLFYNLIEQDTKSPTALKTLKTFVRCVLKNRIFSRIIFKIFVGFHPFSTSFYLYKKRLQLLLVCNEKIYICVPLLCSLSFETLTWVIR